MSSQTVARIVTLGLLIGLLAAMGFTTSTCATCTVDGNTCTPERTVVVTPPGEGFVYEDTPVPPTSIVAQVDGP